MAGSSLLALIDDIATVLDDVAVLTKIAAKKTAGVLGDDLALNAEQVAGIRAERELPVVWAVAKGSLKNKLILVPAALLLSALLPWVVTPLLMLGGAFLCFEGFEKLAHRLLHGAEEERSEHAAMLKALADPEVDLVAFEREKVQGAIRTDFVLSAEIIVIALGTVQEAAFATRVSVVAGIALLMTVGVYSLVAGIVKLDDAGYYLAAEGAGRIRRTLGAALLRLAPLLMKFLAVAGTVAMFMVGGGILLHGIPGSHQLLHHAADAARAVAGIGPLLAALLPSLLGALSGVIAGGVALAAVRGGAAVAGRFRRKG